MAKSLRVKLQLKDGILIFAAGNEILAEYRVIGLDPKVAAEVSCLFSPETIELFPHLAAK